MRCSSSGVTRLSGASASDLPGFAPGLSRSPPSRTTELTAHDIAVSGTPWNMTVIVRFTDRYHLLGGHMLETGRVSTYGCAGERSRRTGSSSTSTSSATREARRAGQARLTRCRSGPPPLPSPATWTAGAQAVGGSEVVSHEVGGRLRVACFDGEGDLPMFRDEARDTSRLPSDGRGGDPLMAVAERVVLPQQQLVAVGGHDAR